MVWCVGGTCNSAPVEDITVWGSQFSSPIMWVLGIKQIFRLGDKHLYQPSPLTGLSLHLNQIL